ncbi:hypothetical protein [Streptomyces hydrogenans]|uniref:hypothetical protein n=1 Tax=Streptomyces hydrogenans TaxID=1873719 RepID=UPI0033AE0795
MNHPEEFKRDAVDFARSSPNPSFADVAHCLSVRPEILRKGVRDDRNRIRTARVTTA